MATQAKDYKAADADLEHIRRLHLPHIARGYLLLAVVKEQLGQLEQAEDAAQRYLARAPNDLAAYKVLCPHRVRQAPAGSGDRYAGERSPTPARRDAETYDMLGRAYASTGRAEDAVKAFQKAQTLAPNNVGVQTRLATVRMGMGEPGVGDGRSGAYAGACAQAAGGRRGVVLRRAGNRRHGQGHRCAGQGQGRRGRYAGGRRTWADCCNSPSWMSTTRGKHSPRLRPRTRISCPRRSIWHASWPCRATVPGRRS